MGRFRRASHFPLWFLLLAWAVPAARGQTIATALDAAELTWNHPPGTLVQSDVTFDGVDAVQLARTGTTALSTTLTGPARMELQVRAFTEANADWFEASVSGGLQVRLSGERPWQKVTLEIPAGMQRVDLIYRKDGMTAHGADAVWVDAVEVLPAEPLSIAGAVDANFGGDITATTAAAEWITLRTPDLSAEGGDVLVLYPVPATATTAAVRLRLPVVGRGRLTLALNYTGSGLPGLVTPEFPLRRVMNIDTTVGRYTTLEFIQPLNAPVPAVEFVVSIPANMTALVDQVRWTPAPGLSVGEALDAAEWPWQPSGGVLPLASAALSSDGEDAVICYDASAAVSLPLPGPARVTWHSLNNPLFTVDGTTRTGTGIGALPGGWTQGAYLVPPGSHALRWQTAGNTFTAFDQQARLDAMTVTPLTTVSIPEAADAPDLTWSAAPDTLLAGIGSDAEALQGSDAIRTTAVTLPTSDWVEAAGSGAGRLHYAWSGVMTSALDGVNALGGAGLSGWTRGLLEVPAGNWSVRWTAAWHASLLPGLDAVAFTPGSGETLSRITDCTPGVNVVTARARQFAGPVEGWAGAQGRQLRMEGSPALTLQTTGSGVLLLRVWAAEGTFLSWGTGHTTLIGGWQDVELPVSADTPGTIVRTTLSATSAVELVVDGITWSFASLFTAAEALDTPGVTWTESHTGATTGWLGRSTPVAAGSATDSDAMVVPALGAGESAELSASLTGSGWLTFSRLVPSGVTLVVLANGVPVFSGSETSGWQREYVELSGAGLHAIIIRVSRASGPSSGVAALSDVSVVPWAEVRGGDAADVPASIVLRTTPQRSFHANRLTGDPLHPEILEVFPAGPTNAILECEVPGPGWLSFEAQGTRGLLNGASVSTLNASFWTPVFLALPPGLHKVRVTADTNQTGAMDNFSLQPASAMSIGEALDQPGWTWTVQGPWSESVPAALAHDGTDAVVFSAANSSSTGSLHTPWPGAGLLSFWWRRAGNAPSLTFTAGSETRNHHVDNQWRREFIQLSAAGGSELVWAAENGQRFSNTVHLLVDDVRLNSYSSVSFAEALDTPGRVWTTGTPAWQTLDDGFAKGDTADYAIAPPLAGLRYLETAVMHPVWVEYDTVADAIPAVGVEPAGLPNLLQPSQEGTAQGWVRRRVITSSTGAGVLRFIANDQAPNLFARLVDRVFIGEPVSATEALDSSVAWGNSYVADGAGFRLNRPVVDGDAVVIQLNAFTGELFTTLTGPGEFSLRCATEWEIVPEPPVTVARVLLGGAVLHEVSSAAGWHEIRYRVPGGSHRLSLTNVRLTAGMLFVDDFRFTPGGTDIVANALDLAGSYGSAGTAWTTHADAAAVGGTALRSPENAAGSVQFASLVFSGAGSLGFSYQLHPGGVAVFTLLLDGEPFFTASPAAAWTAVALPVPGEGEHTLTLQWEQTAPGAFALIDGLTLTPFAAVSVEEALDTTGQTWEAQRCDGVAGPAAGIAGADALRMTAQPVSNEDARLSTTVTGPVRVSFRWFRGAALNSPGFSPPLLSFSVSGHGSVRAAKVHGWEQVIMDVPPGTFTLRWQASASSGASPLSALVDDVSITPVTLPPTLAGALDVPAGVTVNGNPNAWRAVTAPSVPDNDDAVIGIDFSTPISITFSGAGEFAFSCSLAPDAMPSAGVSGANPPALETVWRQPGALYGLDLGRFRFPFALTGSRTVTISPPSSGWLFMLDDVAWRPADALTLADALDTPGLTWTTGTSPPWRALPFQPNNPDPTIGDVAYVVSGVPSATLDTTITGYHSVSLSGVTGGSLRALVNGTAAGDSLGPDTVYLLLPGTQSLRMVPTGSSGQGLSIDSAIVTPEPAPPAGLAGAGVNVTMGPGLWRSLQAGGLVPASALTGIASGGIIPALTVSVDGAGALEFYANGGSLAVDDVLQATLSTGGDWQRHRIELPAAGPHTIVFTFSNTGIADLRWTPGPPVLSAACGLSGAVLFAPSDTFTVLTGGGICVDIAPGRTGLIAAESNEPSLFTWWQQAAATDQVRSPGSATNLFSASTVAQAGPAPAPVNGVPWVPRRLFRSLAPESMAWLLSGSICIGNIRRTPESVPLAGALDLPAGVTATAVSPGSALGYPLSSAADGDVVALRAGDERALLLTASGPCILSYYTSGGSLRITVGTLPPVDALNGPGHVLLGAGPHTVAFGNRPGATAVALMDDVTLLPLTFDPAAALGGAEPMVVTSGAEPATWPLVTSSGTMGLLLPGTDSLYTASGGPARLSFQSQAGATTYFTNYITPPAQLSQAWPAGTLPLWFDRATTARIFTGSASPLAFVNDVHLDTAPPVTFSQALDVNGMAFTASAGVLAHALPQGAVFDGDAVAFALGTAPRTLQTQITGPGRLTFWWRATTPQVNAITCRIGAGAAISYETAVWKQADLAVPAGVQTITWTVSGNLACAELDRVEFFPQYSFSTWTAQNALASLPSVAARAADDSDRDGAAGLLEYAFGLDPGAADAAVFNGSLTGPDDARGLPVAHTVRALDGRDYLELLFPRRLNSGLVYQMQATAHPATAWDNTGTLEVLRPLGPAWELCRTRDTQPRDSVPRRLVRLLVTQP